jgi:Zn-dependent peptidase ImmA (M78 family)
VPVIVLNGRDTPSGRTFTLAHEVGHLLLADGGLCDLHERGDGGFVPDPEVWCNAFAAALLMPRDAFVTEPLVAITTGVQEWSDDDLQTLASRYGTSREAALRRLVTLQRASLDFYRRRRVQFLDEYEELRAAQKAKNSRGPGFDVMRVRDLGRPYIRIVLDAYGRRAITASTMADYLGVRLKHVPKIAERVRAS